MQRKATKQSRGPNADEKAFQSWLKYERDSGNFFWIKRKSPTCKMGEPIGTESSNGYLMIRIFGKRYYSHRLAWFFHYGKWPSDQIDHINGNRKDNRISNLRCVSNLENHKNMKMPKTNTSGAVGVSFNKRDKRWYAQIKSRMKTIPLGSSKDFFEACCIRKSAEVRYRFHINHGRKNKCQVS